MVFGIVVYKAFTGFFSFLFTCLLHTEQGCGIDFMQAECLIVFQEIFPCVIVIVDILYGGRTVYFTTGKRVSSVISSFELVTIVVTEVCAE